MDKAKVRMSQRQEKEESSKNIRRLSARMMQAPGEMNRRERKRDTERERERERESERESETRTMEVGT